MEGAEGHPIGDDNRTFRLLIALPAMLKPCPVNMTTTSIFNLDLSECLTQRTAGIPGDEYLPVDEGAFGMTV